MFGRKSNKDELESVACTQYTVADQEWEQQLRASYLINSSLKVLTCL